MWHARSRYAVALLCIAACSFPAYDLAERDPGTGPTSTCNNRVIDGNEAGVDCGGSCSPCPTCYDGLRNGSETDRDCGGACEQRCSTDQRCQQNTDCGSLVCASVCQPAECTDTVRNGAETGVDCGGSCPSCDNGIACKIDGDCTSMRCQSEVCVSAGCTDGVPNGKETDVDCGGPECAPCAPDADCELPRDCESGNCQTNRVCAKATCSDTRHNQGESDVDCGGEGCDPCPPGASCSVGSDCQSDRCQSRVCVPEHAAGQPLRKAGWRLRSSESATEKNPAYALDEDVTTCWTSGTPQYSGMYVEIDLQEPRYFFKASIAVDTAPYADDIPARLQIYVSSDGQFGDPVKTVNGYHWTWIDSSTPMVGRYVRLVVAGESARNWSIGDITLYD